MMGALSLCSAASAYVLHSHPSSAASPEKAAVLRLWVPLGEAATRRPGVRSLRETVGSNGRPEWHRRPTSPVYGERGRSGSGLSNSSAPLPNGVLEKPSAVTSARRQREHASRQIFHDKGTLGIVVSIDGRIGLSVT